MIESIIKPIFHFSNWKDATEFKEPLFRKARLGTFFLLSLVILAFEFSQKNFLAPSISIPIYMGLFTVAAFNATFISIKKLWLHTYSQAFLLFLDTCLISFLVYQTETGKSLFLFLYFFNILIGASLFGKRGVLLLAAWQSFIFTFLLSSTEIFSKNTYFLLLTNQMAFFGLSFLSLHVLKQTEAFKERLSHQTLKVKTLLDINRIIVENRVLGVIALNDKGHILSMNQVAQKTLPMLSSKMSFSQAWPEMWSRLKKENQGLKETTKDEKFFQIHWNSFIDQESHQKGFVMFLEDNTKQKQLEERIRQKETMAAIGQLSAGLAHEIRNPLASISGSLQMFSELDLDETHQRLLLIVLKEFDRLNDLVTEFLDFARYEKTSEDLIKINSLVNDTLNSVSSEIKKKVFHEFDFQSQETIKGHYDKLKQALLNILLNAYQAMKKTPKPRLKISTYDKGEEIILKIEDNGCGMTKESQQKLFEPFYTTKAKGTGLGMAICHKVLTHHGVEIFVKSKENTGTSFYLHFKKASSVQERKQHEA